MSRAAAFFDIDGTLTEGPSLERRFFRILRHEGKIHPRNYSSWLLEAFRLLPRGFEQVRYGNKAYLRGITCSCHHATRLAASVRFLPDAVNSVAQHAANGERIVLITGTLEFLAEEVAGELRLRLAKQNVTAEISVCATRLEEKEGRWTGRALGQPMFGETKAIAVWWFAKKWKLDLADCRAYGNGASDQWMLASVGKPIAVNPDAGLRNVAERKRWKIVHWRVESNRKARLTKMVPESAQ